MRTFILVPFLLALLGCPLAPLPPEPGVVEIASDAGDYPAPPANVVVEQDEGSTLALASPCGKACENLKAIGCREGFPTPQGISCYRGCVAMARHQRVPTGCWSTKTSPDSVRACGGLRCDPPR